MKVQEILKERGLKGLEKYSIKVTEYDNYVVLNYNQIKSPKHKQVVKECRSLIIDKNNWKVLARGFDRFFNYGEDQHSKDFDITKAACWEKIDGSLVLVWFNPYENKWCAATRSLAHAEGLTPKGNSWLSVIERAFGDSINKKFEFVPKENTYIFEVVSPETRVVKPYPTYDIFLLAIREAETGIEKPELKEWVAGHLNVNRPKTYRFDSIDEIMKASKELDTFDEGYVCGILENGECWRIKVKNPAYLAIANFRNNGAISNRRIAMLVFRNDESEYLQYFPEDREFFEPYIQARKEFFNEINELWDLYGNIENQKEFALIVKDTRCANLLFSLKKGLTLEEALEKLSDSSKLQLLEKYAKKR